MSLPISDLRAIMLLGGLLLAGCDGGGAPGKVVGNAATSPASEEVAAPVDDGRVDCAIGGGEQWSRDCTIEQAGALLTIRHPDGGFRRFRIVTDGRGVIAADGAEGAIIRIDGQQRIMVTAGQDMYRLPATIGAAKR